MTRPDIKDDNRYRLLVERSPYCIHEIDRNGRLVSMNPAGLCMMGAADEAEIVGLDYVSAAAEPERVRIAELLERALAGEPSEFEFTAVNGRIFQSLFEPIRDASGSVTRLMGITQDITERRNLEGQVRRSHKLESVGQLAGGIAHDFNNMLQVILGNLDMLDAAGSTGSSPARSLGAIRRAAEQAAHLTKRLLTVGRRQPMQFEPVRLNEVVAEIHEMMRRTLPPGIEVRLEAAPDLPATRGDSAQLEQVLLNLCLNASQAMPEGGRLTLTTGADAGAETIWVEVADTGCGMDEAAIARAFDPFFTTRAIGSGTGLGLSVVYGIVEAHEGEVAIESEPGHGTQVRVTLPIRAGGEARPAAPRPARGQRILVAEDQAEVRELVQVILSQAGYEVVTAACGAEALEKLEQLGGADLLLLDVVMPNLSGKDVWEQVSGSNVPVLFMSGYSAEALPFEELRAIGARLLEKPFSPDQLLQAVRAAIRAPSPETQ